MLFVFKLSKQTLAIFCSILIGVALEFEITTDTRVLRVKIKKEEDKTEQIESRNHDLNLFPDSVFASQRQRSLIYVREIPLGAGVGRGVAEESNVGSNYQ